MTDQLSRRALILAGSAWAAAPAAFAAIPGGGRLAFQVVRKGKVIGQHVLTFQGGPDDLTVEARVAMNVALGPVTVFAYKHHMVERSKGGVFVSMESDSTTNGKREKVSAGKAGGVVRIKTLSKSFDAPANAAPLTHWNQKSLSGPLFNPQTGAIMRLSASRRGFEPVQVAGKTVQATRWSLSGEESMDDWYDGSGVWSALKAKAKDGSLVEYRRI
jgi:hypothetical protein